MSTEETPLLTEKAICQNHGSKETATADVGANEKKLPVSVKVTLLCMTLTDFISGCYFAMVGPFFPTMAQQKAVGPQLTGLVIACFELMKMTTSPLWGKLIVQTGPRFMYTTGVIICACCSVLFGVLEYCPPGPIFVVMSFLTRSVEGAGAAAYYTASYSIIGILFPEQTGTMFGFLESSGAIGYVVGPLVGGALYQSVGYMFTFVAAAIPLLVIGLVGAAAMNVERGQTRPNAPMCRFLFRPLVAILCFQVVIVAGMLFGYIQLTLALHLKEFNLTPLAVGAVFLVYAVTFTFTTPTVGHLGDKYRFLALPLLLTGVMMSGVMFLFLGPAPFFSIPGKHLWLIILSLALCGVFSSVTSLTFSQLGQAASNSGYPDDLATSGMVAACFNSAQSLGLCLGLPICGVLYDSLGFAWGATVNGFLAVLSAIPLAVYLCLVKSNSNNEKVTLNVTGTTLPSRREQTL